MSLIPNDTINNWLGFAKDVASYSGKKAYEDLITPPLSHRFIVSFLAQKYIPISVNLGFQQVSSLSRELSTTAFNEGGNNGKNFYFPNNIQHGNVILKRGMTSSPIFAYLLNNFFKRKKLSHFTVNITLLNKFQLPVSNWTLSKALPVSWQFDELDANSNKIMIDTLELKYQDMRWIGTKI